MKRTVQARTSTTKPSSARPRVTPQSLLRGDYVTLSKARELLGGAEWRSLRGWIHEMGIKTYAHPTDGRIVLLRAADVEKIAKISDRPLSLPLPERKRARVSSRATLERTLVELQQEHARSVADYEQRLAALQLQIEELQRQPGEHRPPLQE